MDLDMGGLPELTSKELNSMPKTIIWVLPILYFFY